MEIPQWFFWMVLICIGILFLTNLWQFVENENTVKECNERLKTIIKI